MRWLLATSSLASLMAGAVGEAQAACYSGPFGFTNSGNLSCVNVTNTTFSGNIINNGTISGAITYTNSSQTFGGIIDSGTIGGGISIDAHSKINPGNFAIDIFSVSTFGGGISNAGTIGTVSVGGVGTYTGGITNASTGSISATSNAGISLFNIRSFAGGISNGGSIVTTGFDNNAIDIAQVTNFSGDISNTGSVSASSGHGLHISGIGGLGAPAVGGGSIGGNGIPIGVSAFSGNISNTGTISASLDGIRIENLQTFTGNISNGGTITGNIPGITLMAPPVGGGGSITIAGATLSTTNEGTVSSNGVAVHGNGITLSVPTFVGTLTNTGTVTGFAGIQAASTPGLSIFDSGAITGTGGTAVQFSGTGVNTLTLGAGYAITGNVLGSGGDVFQLGGTGTANFDLSTIGAARQYQGFTTFNVVGGTWIVTNTFGQTQAWNVNGGTLAGTGTLSSVNVHDGGTLAPGLPGTAGGTLTISGSLTMTTAATYMVTLSPTTASKTNVSGTANIAGTLIANAIGGNFVGGTKYTLLTAQGGVNGTFLPVVISGNFGFLKPVVTYDANDVFLTLNFSLFTPLLPSNATINERNVAAALDTFAQGGGTLPPGFTNIFNFSPQQILNAINQLTGEVGSGAAQTGFQLTTEFMDLLFNGPGAPGGGGAVGFAPERQELPPEIALAYASVLKAPPAVARSPLSVWGTGFGGAARLDGDPVVMGSSDLSTHTFGAAVGLENQISRDTKVGFALAGAGANWSLSGGLGSGNSDAFQIGVYGTHQIGAVYVSGAVTGGGYRVNTTRNLGGAALPADQLTASFNAQSLGGRLEGGYRIPAPAAPFGVIPYAAVQVQSFWTPSYAESGQLGGTADPFALSFSARQSTATRTELGSRFDRFVPTTDGALGLFGRLAWANDSQSNAAITPTFLNLPTPSFVINGAPLPRNKALTSAGGEWRLHNGWSVLGKFEGEFANHEATYSGTGQIKYTW